MSYSGLVAQDLLMTEKQEGSPGFCQRSEKGRSEVCYFGF